MCPRMEGAGLAGSWGPCAPGPASQVTLLSPTPHPGPRGTGCSQASSASVAVSRPLISARIDAFKLLCWGRLLRVPWTARRSNQSILKEINPEYSLEGLMLNWNSNTVVSWCEEPSHWKRPWCWERVRAGGEEGDRGWDSWMASLTQWTWVWAKSGRWWRTGKPAVLQPMGSQRVGHDWATEEEWHQYLLETCSLEGKTVLETDRFSRVLVTHLMGAPVTLVTASPRAHEMPPVKAESSPRPRAWARRCQVRSLAVADGEQRGGPLTSQTGENTSPTPSDWGWSQKQAHSSPGPRSLGSPGKLQAKPETEIVMCHSPISPSH